MKKGTKRNLLVALAIGAGVGIYQAVTDHRAAEKRFNQQMEEVEKVIRDDAAKMVRMAEGYMEVTDENIKDAKSIQKELDDMLLRRKEEGEKRLKELREEMKTLHEIFMETDDVDVMITVSKRQGELIKELRENL